MCGCVYCLEEQHEQSTVDRLLCINRELAGPCTYSDKQNVCDQSIPFAIDTEVRHLLTPEDNIAALRVD